jgi:hypothetical protein
MIPLINTYNLYNLINDETYKITYLRVLFLCTRTLSHKKKYSNTDKSVALAGFAYSLELIYLHIIGGGVVRD